MQVKFSKELKVCATCMFWDCSEELCCDGLNVDFLSCGKCENPVNSHIEKPFVASAKCLEWVLNPTL
jgi:hypothetical protein